MSLLRTRYLYLYIAMVCCMALLFSIGMRQGRKVYVNRQEQYVQEHVDNIMLTTVSLLEPYYQLCESIAEDRDIAGLRGSQLSEEEIKKVQKVYDSEKLAELGIRQIGIYIVGSNIIITNGQVYKDSQVQNFYDQYDRLISSGYLCESAGAVYRNVRGENFQLLLRKLYDSSGIIGCLILEYNLKGIEDISTDTMQLYIGNNDDYLYARPSCEAEDYQKIVSGANAKSSVSVNGEKCYIPTMIYSKLNTAIRVVVPQKLLHAGAGIFDFWHWGGIALCILMSIPLAVYFYFHLSVPARKLKETAIPEEKANDVESIMFGAGRKIRMLEEKINSMVKDKRYFLPLAMGEKLNRVLATKGSYIPKTSFNAIKMLGLNPDRPCFMFAIHILDDSDGVFQHSEDDYIPISPYNVMNNILSEKIFEKSKGFLGINLNFMPALVQKNEQITYESLVKGLDECKAFMEEFFHVKLAVSRPVLMETSLELQDAYRRTQEEIGYLEFWQKDAYTVSDNERNAAERVPYFKIVRNLVNKLESKNYEEATELFSKVIDEYMPCGQHSWRTDRYQIYALAGIIITAVYEQSGQEKFKGDGWRIVDRMYHIGNINEFREECENLIEEFMSVSGDTAVPGNDKIDEIKKYILENYTDNTLNASSIANYFGKSKSHLSHLFKDAVGINISEYIQRLRVEKAKELLAGYNVKDVVSMSGFWDTQALTRAMKKYEGVTPGEFKKIKGYE